LSSRQTTARGSARCGAAAGADLPDMAAPVIGQSPSTLDRAVPTTGSARSVEPGAFRRDRRSRDVAATEESRRCGPPAVARATAAIACPGSGDAPGGAAARRRRRLRAADAGSPGVHSRRCWPLASSPGITGRRPGSAAAKTLLRSAPMSPMVIYGPFVWTSRVYPASGRHHATDTRLHAHSGRARPAKSLHRMLAPHGNPSMSNLAAATPSTLPRCGAWSRATCPRSWLK